MIPFAPPGINIGNFGGFTFEVLDQGGGGRHPEPRQRRAGAGRRVAAVDAGRRASSARSPPTIRSWRSTSIGRRRAASACRSARSPSAMQIYLGSAYVNDFDFNNRAYRVYVQADKAYRSDPADLGQYYARTTDGRDGAARQRRPRARDDGAAGDQPLQPVPIGADQRRGGARRQLGAGAGGDGAAGRRPRCRRASATRGRASRSRRSRPAGSRPRSSASRCCSST